MKRLYMFLLAGILGISACLQKQDSKSTMGGYSRQVMLVRLKKELNVEDHIGVTLHFKIHQDIIVNVSVQDNAPEGTTPTDLQELFR